MKERLHAIEAEGIALVMDLDVGHIRSLKIAAGERVLTPLHTAPWVEAGEDVFEADTHPNVRCLSGDFLCAPFGPGDVEEAPPHGWPANSPWDLLDVSAHPTGGTKARYRLRRTVSGAVVDKELTLRDGHPFVYQRHVFTGGSGRLPVSTHAMTRLSPKGGRLFLSPKAFGETLASPLEPDPARGVSLLAYPGGFDDLHAVPLAGGGTADLTRQPIAERHEDFALVVEAPGATLGWAVVQREGEGDMVLSLKNPATLPVTMLWMSNGGRSYAPWSNRHRGVLGIEEGCCFGAAGHVASAGANPWNAAGIATALDLGAGPAEIRHVIGGVPMEEDFGDVAAITAEAGQLLMTSASGRMRALPFDDVFLELGREARGSRVGARPG